MFEEEFPSLKNYFRIIDYEERIEIQKHCLDKQKVRDAIENILRELKEGLSDPYFSVSKGQLHEITNTINKHFKELNLGDEK